MRKKILNFNYSIYPKTDHLDKFRFGICLLGINYGVLGF